MRPVLLLLPIVALAQPAFEYRIATMAVDRSAGPVIYASKLSTVLNAPGVYKSLDGGLHWTPLYLVEPGLAQPPVYSLAMLPSNAAVVYAATDLASGGVWRTRDGGATWTRAATGLPSGEGKVNRLFCTPANPRVLYARVGNRVYKTTDGADSWKLQSTLPEAASAFTVNAASPANMYYGTDKVVYSSSDEGVTWRPSRYIPRCGAESTGNASESVFFLATPPTDPGTVFASVVGNPACFFSGETGEVTKWCDTLFRSTDHGSNFTAIFAPHLASVVPDPTRAGTLYLTQVERGACMTSAGYQTTPLHGFYRSENNGDSFVSADPPTGARNDASYSQISDSVLIVWDADRSVLFAGCATGGLCRSNDSGRTWSYVNGSTGLTLAKPVQPLSFTLRPGEHASTDFPTWPLEDRSSKISVQAAVSGGSWFSAKVRDGSPSKVTVAVNAAGLAPGNYQGELRLSAPPAAGATVVTVRLAVVDKPLSGRRYSLSRVAGTGVDGFAGDGGPAVNAALDNPAGLFLDAAGNLYVADSRNHRVRRISASGTIATVAGSGVAGSAGDGGPAISAQLSEPRAVALDAAGNLYIADDGNKSIRKVTPGGTIGKVLDNLSGVPALVPDAAGNVLFGDTGGRLYSIAPSGQVKQLLKSGLGYVSGLAVDAAGNVYATDSLAGVIRRVAPDGRIQIVAGSGLSGFSGDGPAMAVAFLLPAGLAADAAGNIFIADKFNYRVRMLGGDGNVVTIAGTGAYGSSGESGPALAAQFRGPEQLAIDRAGNVYVADEYGNRVLKLTPQAPGPRLTGIPVNAASGEGVAPGGLALLAGEDLAVRPEQAAELPWPATLGEVSVSVNGIAAPLYRAAPTGIAFQIPFEVVPGPATVQVTRAGQTADATFTVAESAPGIVADQEGRAVAENEDGSANRPDNAALPGSVVVVHFTGLGAVDTPVATGAAAPQDPLARSVLPASVTVGGQSCDLDFIGLAPGQAGLAQANVRIPDLPAGDYPVIVTVGSVSSKPAIISVAAPPEAGPLN